MLSCRCTGAARARRRRRIGVNALDHAGAVPDYRSSRSSKHAAVRRDRRPSCPGACARSDMHLMAMRLRCATLAVAARVVAVRQRHADRPRPAGVLLPRAAAATPVESGALADRVAINVGAPTLSPATTMRRAESAGACARGRRSGSSRPACPADTAAESWLREWLLAEQLRVAALRTALR